MRVLLLPHRYPPHGRGGVETWALGLARGLGELGLAVSVATRDDRGIATPFSVTEERREEADTFWIAHQHRDARSYRETWSDPRMERALRSVVRAARPDVMHLGHPDGFGVVPLRLARELGVPLVVTLHDAKWFCGRGQLVPPGGGVCAQAEEDRCTRCLAGQLDRGPLRGHLARLAPPPFARRAARSDEERALHSRPPASAAARRRWRVRQAAMLGVLSGADAVVSPSQFVADLAARHGCERPIDVISNGVPRREPADHWPAGPLRLGWFGVPGPRKGLDVLLAAVARCRPGSVTLEVHGLDADELADWGPPSPAVVARGRYPSDQAAQRMAGVHVVVIPSTWPENQPMVALEARSAGRPLLASNIGGLPELIRDGLDGWLVPPSDAATLASRIEHLASSPGVVRAASAATVAPQDLGSLARAHAGLYRDLLPGAFPAFDRGTTAPAQ